MNKCEICGNKATHFSWFKSGEWLMVCSTEHGDAYSIPIDDYFNDKEDWDNHLLGKVWFNSIIFQEAVFSYQKEE